MTTRNSQEDILNFVKEYRENKTTEAIKPAATTVRKKILWNRVFLALGGLTLVITLFIMGISALFSKEETKIETDSSSVAESSVPDSKSEDSNHVKPVIVTLTDDELSTLVLAVQHECGKDPELFLTIEERSELEALRAKNSNPSTLLGQDEANRLYNLEQFAAQRFDRAQQMTCAAMVQRIGKLGFGVDATVANMKKAENLKDVLEQDGQFPYILEDISHYWELDNADQFDPCDSRTLSNINKVLHDEAGLPKDLFYEVRPYANMPQEEAEEQLHNFISDSPHVILYEIVPCSYSGSNFYLVFGRNDNLTGFGYPL